MWESRILDDVNKVTEWETLAEGLDADGLAPGSRIILTARDTQVLRNCGVADHNMYKVEELNCDETLQLFCKYAFKQNHPTKDFEVLSRVVVKIATNLPLAVKVLGSLLYTKSKRDWENTVDKFQRNVNPEVLDVLKISYDGLDEKEKGLFLDIACFVEFEFRIDEVHFAPNLLSDREFSLSGLIDMSLVTVERGRIKMHDLLREMGREIVDKESPNKPGNHSRLWRQEDVLHTLKHNDGTDAVQGIFLNMLKLKDVLLSSSVFCNRTKIIFSPAGSSYTYWVREATADAAPLPVPKKLNQNEIISNQSQPTVLGSVWNRAGTWEEKNLNKWASDRIKELLTSVGSMEFSGGKAEIAEVSNCSGDLSSCGIYLVF